MNAIQTPMTNESDLLPWDALPSRAPLAAPIDPKQLPEIRAEIVAWLQQGMSAEHWASVEAVSHQAAIDADARRYARFLGQAGLFFVNAEMTDEVIDAADAMPGYSVTRDDPPSPSGLVVWQHPVTQPALMTNLIGGPMIAASWSPHPQGFEVRLWTHQDDWIADEIYAQEHRQQRALPAQVATALRQTLRRDIPVRLVPTTVTVLPPVNLERWPTSAARRLDAIRDGEGMDETLRAVRIAVAGERTLVATWKLMRQEIAAQERAQPERASCKRIARINPDLTTEVRIVSLRRPRPAPGTTTGTGRTGRVYTDREDVRPHWKNVYHPSDGTHDRRWITSYERGPHDAPKKASGELVSVLRR